MIHESVAEYLGSAVDALAYSETDEGNVFIDHYPSTPDRVVALYSAAGPESDSKLPYDAVRLQVIVRCEFGGTWGLRTWEDIYSALHGLRNVTLPDGTEVIFLLAEQSTPFRLSPDAEGRVMLSAHFRGETLNVTQHRGGT